MGKTLMLEISDELYEVLDQAAKKVGKTPEALGVAWFAAAIERVVNDPLFKYAGAISSDVPDWADRHDQYIGQANVPCK
jgi:hypothetical protein